MDLLFWFWLSKFIEALKLWNEADIIINFYNKKIFELLVQSKINRKMIVGHSNASNRHFTWGQSAQFITMVSSQARRYKNIWPNWLFESFIYKQFSNAWFWSECLNSLAFYKERKFRRSFRCICFLYTICSFCIGIIIGKIFIDIYKQVNPMSSGTYD